MGIVIDAINAKSRQGSELVDPDPLAALYCVFWVEGLWSAGSRRIMSDKSLWSFTSTHSHKLGCSLVVVNATRVGEKADNKQLVRKTYNVK